MPTDQRTPTPEMVSLARRILADYSDDEAERAAILEGAWDGSSSIGLVFIAIQQTSELAAKHAESAMPVIQCMSVEPVVSALSELATSYRAATHLKETTHANT